MKSRSERWALGAGKYNQNQLEQRQKDYINTPDKCLFCHSDMPYLSLANRIKRKFCSKSCAAKNNNQMRLQTKTVYQKGLKKEIKCSICFSDIIVGKNANIKNFKCNNCKIKKTYIKICILCEKQFNTKTKRKCCSNECSYILKKQASSLGGRKSASKCIRRSKDEIKLYNLCKDYFNSVRHNEIIKDGWDADIIVDDYKLAILWNGAWHYKQLSFNNHSLSQVQTRDKIKYKILTSDGWNVIIFEDKNYTPESAFNFLKESYKGKI